MLSCTHCADGFVEVNWRLDGELSKCGDCGHEYRVFGDETYDPKTEECEEWWAIVEPGEENPW